MNQKTKISTKFPRSKLGVATAVLSLGGVAVYSLGVINPLQASQSEYLQVDGVQNSVQYLTSLVIDSPTAKVEFKYDDASKAVRASGSLNMQNLVVGQGNESSASSVVFWWTKNNNQWANSVIVWGNNTINEGNNNVIVLSPGSRSSSQNTAILNGQNVVTNGKNITVVNGENSNVRGNYVTVFGDSSVYADHVVVFGDKVTNNESNTFVFNGQDAEFVPEQESAFYANSKVAINGDHANATLDVHGGMMIGHRKMGQDNTYTAWKNPATSGTIALFSKRKQTGLCGYDGKAERRVPLSESARKFWLCAPIRRIWDLPEHAVSKNQKRSFPQVWNQNGRWEWESPKWIYGSKKEPQHFLCADGYVPDVADPIGKTGVKCIPCEWAKLGDLNCTTQKADNSAAKPHCPQGTTYNETSKKCEGTKSTPCVAWDNIVSFNPDTQIETYNADTWIWDITQKCEAKKCQEGFTLEDKRCVPAKCKGQLPENAIGFTGAWNVQWHYDATIKEACSFKCNDSSSDQKNKYFRIKDKSLLGGSCKRCAEGLYNAKIKKCVKGVECDKGFQDDGNGKCKLIANCKAKENIVNVLDDYAEVTGNFRPLGQDMQWKYVDPTVRRPSPNSCEFTCPEGMYPHPSGNFPKCYKPTCWAGNHASGTIANLQGWRTGYLNYGRTFSANGGYQKNITQPALDANTLEEFKEKYKNKPGCWERCPGLKELKEINENTDWACDKLFKQKTPKTPKTPGDNEPYCRGYKTVYGKAAIKGSSSPSQTTERKIVWNTQAQNPPACTTYCPYVQKTWADVWFEGSDADDLFCLNPNKGCEYNQILDTSGKCVDCHGINIGNPKSAKLAGYPTRCIDPCTHLKATYNEATGKCEKDSEINKKCPEGWTLENNKCVSSPTK